MLVITHSATVKMSRMIDRDEERKSAEDPNAKVVIFHTHLVKFLVLQAYSYFNKLDNVVNVSWLCCNGCVI